MVSNGFTEAKDLEKLICKRCTVTSTDIVAVLDALSHAMQDEFLQGRRVHLQGIGYFHPTIQAVPETDMLHDIAPYREISECQEFQNERK